MRSFSTTRVTPYGVAGAACVRCPRTGRAVVGYALVPWSDVAQLEEVGGFFGDLANGIKNVVTSDAFKNVAKGALDVAATVGVPGAGAARTALSIAERALGGAKKSGAAAAASFAKAAPSGATRINPMDALTAVQSTKGAQAAQRHFTATHRTPSDYHPDLRWARWYVYQLPPHERVPAIKQLLGLR